MNFDFPVESRQQQWLSRWRYLGWILISFLATLLVYDVQFAEQATTVNALVRFKEQLQSTGIDRTDAVEPKSTLEIVREHRDHFVDRLKLDYGPDNFARIFQDESDQPISRGRSLFTSPHGYSWTRLKQKFMIKLIQARLAVAEGDETFSSRLVWATGGHSSAAGHGNFLSEAYTAVMERTMKPIFAATGIDFDARPYAMGGTSSGEELALCIEQVFGEDIDM